MISSRYVDFVKFFHVPESSGHINKISIKSFKKMKPDNKRKLERKKISIESKRCTVVSSIIFEMNLIKIGVMCIERSSGIFRMRWPE